MMLDHLVLPGVSLYSLQVGPRAGDIVQDGAQALVKDLSPLIRDLSDTACLVSQLDVVVTVDTAVAHLAGGLGARTSLLLPIHGCDWRWGNTGMTTPWYSSVLLRRQKTMGEWSSALKDTAAELRNMVARKGTK